MKPSDVPPEDWSLYFDRCWMQDDATKEIYKIRVTERLDMDGEQAITMIADIKTSEPLNTNRLIPWWPRPGSYNYNNNEALYIGKQAVRNMSKSATARHYYIVWGPRQNLDYVMHHMAKGPTYVPYEDACAIMENKVAKSVAISRDLIIKRVGPNTQEVIYKGTSAGTLSEGMWSPLWMTIPRCKRAARALRRENIECN